MKALARLLTAAALAGGIAAPVAAQYPQPDPYQQQYPYPQQYPQQYPNQGYPGYPNQGYPGQTYPYGQNVVGSIVDSLIGNRYNVDDRQAIHQCANAVMLRARNQYGGYNNGYPNNYPQPYGIMGGNYRNVRITAITDVQRRSNGGIRVRGLLNSGMYPYDPRYSGAGDLKFRCDADYRGYIYDVRLDRNDDYHYRRY